MDLHAGQEENANRHHRRSGNRPKTVLSRLGNDLPRTDRHDEQARHQRQEPDTGQGRRDAAYYLEERRQVDDRPEHREPDDEADNACDPEGAHLEEVQRQHRLGGTALNDHEHAHQDHAQYGEGDDRGRSPGVRGPTEACEQYERGRRSREHRSPEVVDDVVDPSQVAWHPAGYDNESNRTDREVDVEDPAPREVIDEEPAEQRPNDAGEPENGAEEAHVAAAIARRDYVADDRLRPYHQPARAEALCGPKGDELDHRMAEPGKSGPDEEYHDRRLEEELPPVLVAELAPQRGRDGRGQEVCSYDPSDMGTTAEVAHNRGERCGDDRLVERGEQHPEHQCPDDDEHPPVV